MRERFGRSTIIGPQTVTAVDLKQAKSQREMLEMLAQDNGGVLVAKDAIRAMRAAEIFGNPANAESAVYSNLNRSRRFQKVAPGIYRLGEPLNTTQRQQRHGKGLVDIVRELRQQNPIATRGELADVILRQGFDFGGKNPKFAVSAAWMFLAREKKRLYPEIDSLGI